MPSVLNRQRSSRFSKYRVESRERTRRSLPEAPLSTLAVMENRSNSLVDSNFLKRNFSTTGYTNVDLRRWQNFLTDIYSTCLDTRDNSVLILSLADNITRILRWTSQAFSQVSSFQNSGLGMPCCNWTTRFFVGDLNKVVAEVAIPKTLCNFTSGLEKGAKSGDSNEHQSAWPIRKIPPWWRNLLTNNANTALYALETMPYRMF